MSLIGPREGPPRGVRRGGGVRTLNVTPLGGSTAERLARVEAVVAVAAGVS